MELRQHQKIDRLAHLEHGLIASSCKGFSCSFPRAGKDLKMLAASFDFTLPIVISLDEVDETEDVAALFQERFDEQLAKFRDDISNQIEIMKKRWLAKESER